MEHASRCVFCELCRTGAAMGQHGPFWMMFDRHPVAPGHTLVIPKRHVMFLTDFNDEERSTLTAALEHAVKDLRQHNLRRIYEEYWQNPVSPTAAWFARRALDHPRLHTKPDAYNYILNEGEAAGQTVDHLHWHVIPRYVGDTPDPVGGGRHVIAGMGNYKVLPPPPAPVEVPEDEGMEEDLRASRDMTPPRQ